MNELQHDLKKEFQLERMILFSDAVFAIAITLMAIEIKVPVLEHEVTDHQLLKALLHLGLKFSGFLISFFIIGLYWTVHHRMMGYVENYNNKLLWLNLIFLLSIVLMPFSSGLYGEYSYSIFLHVPYGVYVANIGFTGLMNYVLWKYIGNPANKLASPALTPALLSYSIKRSVVTPIIFIVSFFVTLFSFASIWFGIIGRWFPMLIPVIMKRLRKKAIYAATTQSSPPSPQ